MAVARERGSDVSAPPRPPEPILHVDMDAFFAAVEVRRRPELAGRPVLVGGRGGRGVVASASYEARVYGIHSAMPMAQALRRCPDAVVVSPDFAAYAAASEQLRGVLLDATPLVEPLSLDEAFLDVSGAGRLLGGPVDIAHHIRDRIRTELDLVASVGVAPNKLLAKMCSGRAKPDGLLHLKVADVAAFLAPLHVGELWGVGQATATRLERFGIRTLGELAATPVPTVARLLGQQGRRGRQDKAPGDQLARQLVTLAAGHDTRRVVPYEAAKGMSAEETFSRDVDDLDVLRRELLRLAEKVARRLRRGGVAARTVTLKLRYANFQTITRSRTLPLPSDEATRLHAEVTALLDALRLERVRVRLVGLGTSNLVPVDASRQLDLYHDDRWGRLERAADHARTRFGDAAVTRGALLDDGPRGPNVAPVREQFRTPGPRDAQ